MTIIESVVKEPREGYALETITPRDMDFSTDPETVRLVMQGRWLAHRHLVNSALGSEIPQMQPLPHQRSRFVSASLSSPRLRFVLADDAGADKTIMTGLYIPEQVLADVEARLRRHP